MSPPARLWTSRSCSPPTASPCRLRQARPARQYRPRHARPSRPPNTPSARPPPLKRPSRAWAARTGLSVTSRCSTPTISSPPPRSSTTCAASSWSASTPHATPHAHARSPPPSGRVALLRDRITGSCALLRDRPPSPPSNNASTNPFPPMPRASPKSCCRSDTSRDARWRPCSRHLLVSPCASPCPCSRTNATFPPCARP